ncbi:hypothetical protein [Amorphus sp. MBR-141]
MNEGDGRVDHTKLRTVKQIVGEAPWLTEGKMRWWLFHRHANGLDQSGAIVRVGGRIYIHVDGFQAWLAEGSRAA